jgi:predicted enzyme related to lactoylglutathione lyase
VQLLFQPVADPTPGKNRMHLDVAAESDQQAEVERLVGLGARVLDEAPDHPWVVLADPEGNEFCVLAPQ